MAGTRVTLLWRSRGSSQFCPAPGHGGLGLGEFLQNYIYIFLLIIMCSICLYKYIKIFILFSFHSLPVYLIFILNFTIILNMKVKGFKNFLQKWDTTTTPKFLRAVFLCSGLG